MIWIFLAQWTNYPWFSIYSLGFQIRRVIFYNIFIRLKKTSEGDARRWVLKSKMTWMEKLVILVLDQVSSKIEKSHWQICSPVVIIYLEVVFKSKDRVEEILPRESDKNSVENQNMWQKVQIRVSFVDERGYGVLSSDNFDWEIFIWTSHFNNWNERNVVLWFAIWRWWRSHDLAELE